MLFKVSSPDFPGDNDIFFVAPQKGAHNITTPTFETSLSSQRRHRRFLTSLSLDGHSLPHPLNCSPPRRGRKKKRGKGEKGLLCRTRKYGYCYCLSRSRHGQFTPFNPETEEEGRRKGRRNSFIDTAQTAEKKNIIMAAITFSQTFSSARGDFPPDQGIIMGACYA